MAKYLLELGVEELPYSLIDPISKQIKENFEKKLEENNAKFTNIKTFTTPRRLVFIIDGLTEVQEDTKKVFRGPNVKVAYDVNGNFTQAALGFSRKFNVDPSNLYKIEDAGQEYVALTVHEKGKSVTEIIPQIISDCVLKVQGSHFMRWSNFDEKFSRPIRWIVSILDNKEIPVEIIGIKSSKISRAHRFCNEKFPEITDVDSYFTIMHNHNVIVDEEERKSVIVKGIKELAETINAEVKIEDELLKEVTNIVEWPKPVLGNFDEKYLVIPEPVIVTVMASHQRYFPLYDKNGKLLNGFITVANFVGDDISNIKNGNERVIKARLDDAIFFYKEDIKKPLSERVDDLEGMTFQKGLGTLKDKVNRIVKISDFIAKKFGYFAVDQTYKNIIKTAQLCKADLTTSLVFEFTELQGVIGAHYAKVFNENDCVSKGIEEHYYPLVADAQLANGIEGQIVGIADKIDTICSVFILNKIPTGSIDPLGVRRATVGIIQTIMQKKLNINVKELIEYSLSIFDINTADKKKLKHDIEVFFMQRLKGIFGNNYRNDIIEAVLNAKNVLADLQGMRNTLKLLEEVSSTPEFDKLAAAHTRIKKLVANINFDYEENDDVIDLHLKDVMSEVKIKSNEDVLKLANTLIIKPELFQSEAEDDFYRFILGLSAKKMLSPRDFYQLLTDFIPIIDKFFEDVMVMDENVSTRNNRLKLLAEANKQFLKVADFTKIIKQ